MTLAWTTEDTAELVSAANAYKEDGKQPEWETIGPGLGKTPESCRARYARVCKQVNPVRRTRWPRWTAQEKTVLAEACRTAPVSWSLVSDMVGTKTARECRVKWLASTRKFTPLTDTEREYLVHAGPIAAHKRFKTRPRKEWRTLFQTNLS